MRTALLAAMFASLGICVLFAAGFLFVGAMAIRDLYREGHLPAVDQIRRRFRFWNSGQ